MIDAFNSLVKFICLYCAWVIGIIVVIIVPTFAYRIYLAIRAATRRRRMLKKTHMK